MNNQTLTDLYCEGHDFYYQSDDQCPVCEGMEIVKERVRELHDISVAMNNVRRCTHCDSAYPCPTIKVLDGEQ